MKPSYKSFTCASFIARYLKLNSEVSSSWKLRWTPVCASTEKNLSEWIKKKPIINNEFRALFSRRQNHGTGQNGKIWNSLSGGIWLSSAIPFHKKSYCPELLGLALAVALSKRIESYGVLVKIKWPNDLIVGNRKLAGFLPKLISRGNTIRYARIGIGLNVYNKVPLEGISLDKIIDNHNLSLGFWCSEVLLALEDTVNLMKSSSSICEQAKERLWEKKIFVKDFNSTWEIKGFNNDGGLIIQKGRDIKVIKNWH